MMKRIVLLLYFLLTIVCVFDAEEIELRKEIEIQDVKANFDSFFRDPNKYFIDDYLLLYRRDWHLNNYVLVDCRNGKVLLEKIINTNLKNVVGVYEKMLAVVINKQLFFYNVFSDKLIQPNLLHGTTKFYWLQEDFKDKTRLYCYDFNNKQQNEIALSIIPDVIREGQTRLIDSGDNTLVLCAFLDKETYFYNLQLGDEGLTIIHCTKQVSPYSFAVPIDKSSYFSMYLTKSYYEGLQIYHPLFFDHKNQLINEYFNIYSWGDIPFRMRESFFSVINIKRDLVVFFDYENSNSIALTRPGFITLNVYSITTEE